MRTNFYSTLIVFSMLFGFHASAQWQTMYLPSQYWPTSDVKSYNSQLWAGANSGVFRSADNGTTWSDLTQGFASTSSSSFRELVFTSAGNIYVRTTTKGVIRSMDGGTTWGYDTTGIGFTDIQSIWYDSNSDRVFIGLTWPKYGLWYKKPSEAAWTNASSTEFSSNLTPVQITGKGNSVFVIDVASFIYESTDGGITWTKKTGTNLPQSGASNGASKFLSVGNDLYLGVTGVWKSSNDGDTWTRIDTGFALTANLYVDTRGLYYDGSFLYASIYEKNTYKSPDMGVSWYDMGKAEVFLTSFAKHNNTLYAAGYGKDSIFVYGTSSGIEENQAAVFSLYPNPASNVIKIQTDNNRNYSFQIVNSIGEEMYFQSSLPKEINLSEFPEGIYFLRMANGSEMVSRKIILTK